MKIQKQIFLQVLTAIELALCQTFLFVLLCKLFSRIYFNFGFESFSRIDFGWMIKIDITTYIYSAISMLCGISAAFLNKKGSILIQFAGFISFTFFFIEDLIHLSSWVHPYRALLVVLSAAVNCATFSWMIFKKRAEFI